MRLISVPSNPLISEAETLQPLQAHRIEKSNSFSYKSPTGNELIFQNVKINKYELTYCDIIAVKDEDLIIFDELTKINTEISCLIIGINNTIKINTNNSIRFFDKPGPILTIHQRHMNVFNFPYCYGLKIKAQNTYRFCMIKVFTQAFTEYYHNLLFKNFSHRVENKKWAILTDKETRIDDFSYNIMIEPSTIPNIEAVVKNCLSEILRKRQTRLLDEKKVETIYEIEKLIRRDYAGKSLSLEKISDNFHISTSDIKKYFIALHSNSMHDLLLECKMKKAIELLKSGEKIRSIANAVGYSRDTAFNHAFEKFFGVAPSHYKEPLHK